MFDLYDFLTPRVYVVSEKHYENILNQKRQKEVESLKEQKDRLKLRLEAIDKELVALEA